MRAFIAIAVPSELKDIFLETQKSFFDLGLITFVKKEHMHITLKFFRDVSETQLTIIKERLRRISFSSFEIIFKDIGVFPNEDNARVLWVGAQSNELLQLYQEIDKVIEEFFKTEEFHAHLTLGRIKYLSEKKEFKERLQKKTYGSFFVKEFSLIKSELQKD